MIKTYEIRLCKNEACGLRYPRIEGQTLGARCPACLGETDLVLTGQLMREEEAEPRPDPSHHISVLLDNIRSAGNVGSILRSADGFGFRHAYLCGISVSPEKSEVQKTSLGANETVEWSMHPDGVRLARELKAEGFSIIALETVEESEDIRDWEPTGSGPEKLVLVLGSEVSGIDPELLALADTTVKLPMFGKKRSLNVAVAFGIAAFELTRKLIDRSAR